MCFKTTFEGRKARGKFDVKGLIVSNFEGALVKQYSSYDVLTTRDCEMC